MSSDGRRRVAILGGGAAGLAAAYELTKTAELRAAFDVTVYQHGWRLGGKGASGRNERAHDRIEEHGLHLWFGFYENAFGLLGDCYEELRRQGRAARFETCADAFVPCQRLGLTEAVGPEWHTRSFPLPAGNGGGRHSLPWAIAYLLRLLAEGLERLLDLRPGQEPDPDVGAGYGALRGAVDEAENEARRATPASAPGEEAVPESRLAVVRGLRGAEDGFAAAAERLGVDTPVGFAARLAGFAKSVVAILTLRVAPRVGHCEAPFDHLNAVELRDALRGARDGGRPLECPADLRSDLEWLRREGLLSDDRVLDSSFVRVLYDLAFAYRDGDPAAPDVAAGVALENLLNITTRHKGVLMHKMRAGMGDVVFAPLYRLLGEPEAAGSGPRVRFEFFSAVERVDAPAGRVERIEIRRQAALEDPGSGYRPLREVNELPCWPSEPLADQLDRESREALESLREGSGTGEHPMLAFERDDPPDPLRRAESVVLREGEEFDDVVLAVPVGAHSRLTAPLEGVAGSGVQDAAFAEMGASASPVATNAFQIWLNQEPAQLGLLSGARPGETTVLGNYRKPFDTYCDMTHLIPEESWRTRRRQPPDAETARSIAYFCGPMQEPPADWREADRRAGERALQFLEAHRHNGHGRPFWRTSFAPWMLVADRWVSGWDRFRQQYWRANATGWERYSTSHAGTMEHRLRADGSRPDRRPGMRVENLVLAGDWTHTPVNAGSVEAAVISGIEAARALIRKRNVAQAGPPLDEPEIAVAPWRGKP